jgi:hypothetical protein
VTPGLIREAFDEAARAELARLFMNLTDRLASVAGGGPDSEQDARAAFEHGVGVVRRAYGIAAAAAAATEN